MSPPSRPVPPRLFRVRYCSEAYTCGYHADGRGWDACSDDRVCRKARRELAFVKCPYGGVHDLYAMTAALARAVYTRQIRWFKIETKFEITPEIRAALLRWPEALARTSERTGVTWE